MSTATAPAPAEVSAAGSLRSRVIVRARRRYGRTPDRLVALLAGLVLLAAGTGVAGLAGVRDRAAALDEATGTSSRLSVAAVTAYQSLSDADATAAGAFLAAGAEPPQAGRRYNADIAQAAAALSTLTAGAPTGEAAAAVAELAGDLPVYAGKIETARAYNRQGLPLGAAYLREASTLARERMLPAAQRLYQIESGRLAAAQDAGAAAPWLALTLGVLTIAALVAVQVHLTRTTNRLLNIGLLAATAGTLVSVGWLGIAAGRVAADTGTSRRAGTEQIEALAQARIAVLQARSFEALTLVARGTGAELERQFAATMVRLDGPDGLLALATARTAQQPETQAEVRAAADALRLWRAVHADLRRMDDAGQYSDAVALATGPASTTAGSLASTLDAHLGTAIDHAGERFGTAAAQARGALSGVGAGVALIMTLAAAASAAGMWPRIAEYR
jgi:hypothetical protein